MSKQPNTKNFFRAGALIGAMALSGLAGCGEGIGDPTASISSALTVHSAGPYGSTLGTVQPSGNHTTAVTRIDAYYTSAYVLGIRLYWGTTSTLYGQTGGVPADSFDLDGESIHKVRYVVSSGVLRGIKFSTESRTLEAGLTPCTSTAFNDPDAALADLQIWQGSINGRQVIWGARFDYATP